LVFTNSKINGAHSKHKGVDDSSKRNKFNIDCKDDNDLIHYDTKRNKQAIKHIVTSEINVGKVIHSMNDKNGQSGATVVFTGSVRNAGKSGPVTEMYYEAYTEMAEKMLQEIEHMAIEKWGINCIRIIHRIGRLQLGDLSVVIAISSTHSKEAFEACEKILAMIKQVVPIWKKELLSNGKEQWVEGKEIHANNRYN
jgi:molybdopterin synthase catalytic subunit